MTLPLESFTYQFSELVFVAYRPKNRIVTTWYLQCPECQREHMFRKIGSKYWVATCEQYRVEYTVTPADYYVKRPADFSLVMGGAEA